MALSSIYAKEFRLLSKNNPKQFSIEISPCLFEDEKVFVTVELLVTLPRDYPIRSPICTVSSVKGVDKEHLKRCSEIIAESVKDNEKTICIFNICEAIKAYLVEINFEPKTMYEEMIERHKKQKEVEEIESESDVCHSEEEAEEDFVPDENWVTPCNRSNFEKWAKEFYAKIDSERMQRCLEDGKMTGKQIFEQKLF